MSKLIEEIHEHRDMMFRMALPICGHDAEAAEDVVQDAYVRAIRYIGGFDPEKSLLSTWLCQITKNVALGRLRRAKTMVKVELNEETMDLEDEPEEDWSDDPLLHEDVLEAISRVPVLVRYGLVDDFIAYYSGAKGHMIQRQGVPRTRPVPKTLSYQEIADKHGLKINTLKTAFNRARRHLQRSELNPTNKK